MFRPIIKVVSSSCNLRCIYCYYEGSHAKKLTVMSEKTLTNLIKRMLSFGNEKHTYFCWHGGEPLLAGIDYYKKIISLQEKLNIRGKEIKNSIQTNATLLDEHWADFLEENGFKVGISLDGPEDIQNSNRPTSSGGESFSKVMRGLNLLQSRSVFPSVISVTTRNSVGKAKEIFDFFQENKISKFLPKDCCEKDSAGDYLPFSTTPDEYVDFMIEMFESWMSANNPNIEIINLYQIIKGIVGGSPNLCEYSGRCHLFLTIGCDGSLSGCDSFPINNYQIGNINETPLENLLASPGYNHLTDDISSVRVKCKECEWFGRVCGGGCMSHSYSAKNSSWGENFFCDAKRRLFKYIEKRVFEIQRS